MKMPQSIPFDMQSRLRLRPSPLSIFLSALGILVFEALLFATL